MKALRPYQKQAIEKIDPSQRTLLVAPTGSGKTVMGAEYVRQYLEAHKGARVLWLAHRYQLVKQAVAELRRRKVDAYLFHGENKQPLDSPCLVTTVQTLTRYPELLSADLLVVDEAHRIVTKGYEMAVAAAKSSLGLTATPWRLDGRGLHSCFDTLVQAATVTELLDMGYLHKPLEYTVAEETVRGIRKGIKVDRDTKEAGVRMVALAGDLLAEHRRLADGRPTLVFAVNRSHGREIERLFRQADYSTAYVDQATTEARRQEVLAGLESRAIDLVVNVNVYAEGLDCESIGCIVQARPTTSLTMHLQQIGRATRNASPIVIDHAGNVSELGSVCDEFTWSLDDRKHEIKAGRPGERVLVRRCPKCGFFNPKHVESCIGPVPNTLPGVVCGQELGYRIEVISGGCQLEQIEVLRSRIASYARGQNWTETYYGQVSQAILGPNV